MLCRGIARWPGIPLAPWILLWNPGGDEAAGSRDGAARLSCGPCCAGITLSLYLWKYPSLLCSAGQIMD